MGLSEQRDPAFWRAILNDPDVSPTLHGASAEAVIDLLDNPGVLPLATSHGGFLFVSRCNYGKVFEFHTAFTRQGWGREAYVAAILALRDIFSRGAEIVFTHEQIGAWRTRPPKSFGFEPVGPAFEVSHGQHRLWKLERARWEDRPAALRAERFH